MKTLSLDLARVRIVLRRLFRRTPPQRESGWTRLDREMPTVAPANRQACVEFYNATDDSLSRVYVWSLSAYAPSERSNFFWRHPEKESAGDEPRCLAYYLRSRTIFG